MGCDIKFLGFIWKQSLNEMTARTMFHCILNEQFRMRGSISALLFKCPLSLFVSVPSVHIAGHIFSLSAVTILSHYPHFTFIITSTTRGIVAAISRKINVGPWCRTMSVLITSAVQCIDVKMLSSLGTPVVAILGIRLQFNGHLVIEIFAGSTFQ